MDRRHNVSEINGGANGKIEWRNEYENRTSVRWIGKKAVAAVERLPFETVSENPQKRR